MAMETATTWGCCDDARVVGVVAKDGWARTGAVVGGLRRRRRRTTTTRGDSAGDAGVGAIERTTVYTV
jgi:hypothetical protein